MSADRSGHGSGSSTAKAKGVDRFSRLIEFAEHAARVAASAEVPGRVENAVERQVQAYNSHDLDGFLACYAETAVVEDADGCVLVNGPDEMRHHYRRVFEASPNLHAEIVSRMRVGSYIVDQEHVTGRPDGDLHAIAIYRLNEAGLIDRVRFLR